MLRRLSIQNYAIIDRLEIDFSANLNVLTGETGAGKSIIVGALGLILGERAETQVLLNRDKKCFVEGFFDAEGKQSVIDFLKENDLDTGDELVIRREIGTNGKSRAFINDTPVGLNQLQQLSSLLVDLHQQFDSLELGESGFQMQVMDALAVHASRVSTYQVVFQQWQATQKELEKLKDQKEQFDKELGYHQFQLDELEEAGFSEDELENLHMELKLQQHAEGIRDVLAKVHTELKNGETPLVQQLKILLNQLQSFTSYHPVLPSITERLQSAQIELMDIADETERIGNQVHYDADKIDRINDRLNKGYRLFKKHGVKTTNELIAIKQQLQRKLETVLNIDQDIQQNEQLSNELYMKAWQLAEKISDGRQKQIKSMVKTINTLLIQVGMPNARFLVEVRRIESLNEYGIDSIEFLFDANRNDRFMPVAKVASGGELSRLMLCIKSLVAETVDLPTLIFDEIDTGISGEAARQIGIIMKRIVSKRQLICITHQPQIAGRADAHFLVYKEIKDNAVRTNIRLLSSEERITAIATMLSGEKPTAAAIENAREMVMN